MKDNTAKDLLALSCIAFQQNDLESSASLFSCAMSLNDSRELIDSLLEDNYTGFVLAESLANSDPDVDIASMSSKMSDVLNAVRVKRKRQELRSDQEDLIDLGSQSVDSVEEDELETVSKSKTQVKTSKSPLSIKF